MATTQTGESDIFRRGEEIYAGIRDKVESEANIGKIISIDVETGDYVIDDDLITSGKKLLALRPNAKMYGARIGYDAVYGVGSSVIRTVK